MSRSANPAPAARQLYEQAMLGSGGAWSCDLATEVLTWTNEVYDLFGLPRGSKLKRATTLDAYQSQSRSEMEQHRAAAVATGQGFVLDCQLRAAGQIRWMRLRVGVDHDCGRPIRIFGSKQDVTAEKKMWDGLVTIAGNDPLTGLANRRAFEEAVNTLSLHADAAHGFALAVLSIDDIETIRDKHDSAGAHECLRCIGRRLARLFPDAVLVSRIGGCEFALLLHAARGPATLAATLFGAHRLLARPVPRDARAIEIGITLGASMMKATHRHAPKKLFAEADAALYVAKAAGGNCFRMFDGMIAGAIGHAAAPLRAG